MHLRLLLAGTAALLGASAAQAEISAWGGAAVFTLPPMPGLTYTAVAPDWGFVPGLPVAAAYGVVPIFGFEMKLPGAGKIGGFASGFHAAGAVGYADEPLTGGAAGNIAFYSIYNGYATIGVTVDYPTDEPAPGDADAYVLPGTPGNFTGFTFDLASDEAGLRAEVCQLVTGVEDDEACTTFEGDGGMDPFGYAMMAGDAGVLAALGGVLPEGGHVTRSESSGFRYFGGQSGMTVDLDFGGAQATASLGGLFRQLAQHHETVLDIGFDFPVDGGTLSLAQTFTASEDLVTRYIGNFFGLSVETNANSRLVARFDVGAAPVLALSQYTGVENATLDLTAPGTDLHLASDMPAVVRTDLRFAALLNARGEVGFRLGRTAKISVGGFVEFLSSAAVLDRYARQGQPDVPDPVRGVDNAAGTAISINGLTPTQPGVTIGYQPMLTYGASVRLSIGIGGP